MKNTQLALLLAAALSTSALAGTTGVVGINDLRFVSGCGGPVQGSASLSGAPASFCTGLACGGTLTIDSSAPGMPAFVLYSFAVAPDTIVLPPSVCPIPFSVLVASGPSNQSIDLALPFGVVSGLTTNFAGDVSVPVPAFSAPLAVQGVVLDPFCGSAIGVSVTQALTLLP